MLSGRVLDSRPKGRGFEPHRRHCVVSLSKNIYPSLVLVQPRKTRPFITERLLMGRKESKQTNKLSELQNFAGSSHVIKKWTSVIIIITIGLWHGYQLDNIYILTGFKMQHFDSRFNVCLKNNANDKYDCMLKGVHF